MTDIAPELHEAIQKRFQEKLNKAGSHTKNIRKKLEAGTATFRDADLYAIEVGSMLSESMMEVLQLDQMPNGQFYYNIANRTLGQSLQDGYGLVSSVAAEVQEELNQANGIGLKAITPEANKERINGLVDKAVEAPDQETLNKLLKAPVENVLMSAVDDTVKANVQYQSKAGLQPIIRRTTVSKCCDWCEGLAGTYKYPDDVPDDVYRRHQNCRCTVEYVGAGKRQDVWNKKEDVLTREEAKRLDENLLNSSQNGYYGVPKTWKKTIENLSDDEILKGTNPRFKKNWTEQTTWIDSDYNLNCTNCIPAYEMRCRGYDVIAKPLSQNRGLEIDPFLAWENARPLSTGNLETLISFVNNQNNGDRIQVATVFPNSIWRSQRNHTFVAVKENDICIFKDPQSGAIIKNINDYFDGAKEIRYLKINDMEITDKGVSACEFIRK